MGGRLFDPDRRLGDRARRNNTATPITRITLESQALYNLLEKQIIPVFYQRSVDNVPREWIARMKICMRKFAPVFNTNRMVKEYAEQFYIPSHTARAGARRMG